MLNRWMTCNWDSPLKKKYRQKSRKKKESWILDSRITFSLGQSTTERP